MSCLFSHSLIGGRISAKHDPQPDLVLRFREQNVYYCVQMKEVNGIMDTLTNSVEELYTMYHKDIVYFFAEHLADREAAWDLCHEVFVRLLITLASGTQVA